MLLRQVALLAVGHAAALSLTLAHQQGLVVCSIGDLVRIDVLVALHFFVKLLDLVKLVATAARLEQSAVDDLYLSKRSQTLLNVLEQLTSEEDHLGRVCLVHGQRCAENLKPEAVNHFGHVASPLAI